MNEAMKFVERGAALLDQEMPGWEEKIDLSTLDLGNCCQCIGGQLFGLYSTAVARLGIGEDGYLYGMNWQPFEGPHRLELKEAWGEAIESRREFSREVASLGKLAPVHSIA